MKRWIAGTMCAMVCTMACAQVGDEAAAKTRLDQVVKSYADRGVFMGTVLVASDDHILLDKGYGMADIEWGIPNEPAARYRIGSLTKQFTAALVLLLQQDGKLSINDPVSKYLPDAPKSWEKITLAHLLGHTSGIPSFTEFKEFPAWCMSPHTPDEELAFFRDRALDFVPGGKFAYSNSNYVVLGVVLEKVSGQKFGQLLQERLLDPIGMKNTGMDADDLVLPKRAQGYKPGKAGPLVARSESLSVPFSAGAMYSTTADFLKWEQALFGGKVLSADSIKLMTTPNLGNYGMGLVISEKDKMKVFEHGGGIEGFNTNLVYIPDKKITVVILSNINSSSPVVMTDQLLDVALGKPVKLSSERKALSISKEELSRFAGTYELNATFSLVITPAADGLTVQGTGQQAVQASYTGNEGGHPRFFVTAVDAELEFLPGAKGAIDSLVLHQSGQLIPAKRK